LGLGTNGFNPWSLRNSQYTVWIVVIVVYNLPRGMATKNDDILL
jgi:hypothetical protein